MKKAYGTCWVCTRQFWHGVDTVPSVPVDKLGRAVPEDDAHGRAPICPKCVGDINLERGSMGLPLLVADPYASRPAEPPAWGDVRGGYLVVQGNIIRPALGDVDTVLNPMAGLPDTIQPNPAPPPHAYWQNADGTRQCLPWCWCEIKRHNEKVTN